MMSKRTVMSRKAMTRMMARRTRMRPIMIKRRMRLSGQGQKLNKMIQTTSWRPADVGNSLLYG